MFGKGSLIFVAGFSMILSMYQVKLSKITIAAADNFNLSYTKTLVHEETMNAINMGISNLWDTEEELDSFYVITSSCSAFVKTSVVGADLIQVKVVTKTRAGTGLYGAETMIDSVTANFSFYTPISEYLLFTNSDAGNYWVTGDTVFGPMHCNSVLRTSGSPVFYGKVTANNGISPNPAHNGNQAHFYGGWEIGIEAELPSDMSAIVEAAIAANDTAAMNTKSLYNTLVQFEFLANGAVVRILDTTPDTLSLMSIAPTGVIYSTADVRVKGVLNGNLTLYTTENIWIDDDLTYASDPRDNPESDDLLGLIAGVDIIVTDNYENNMDVNLHGSILALGRFAVENYDERPDAGVFELVGSIAQAARGPMGQYAQWNNQVQHGFAKKFYHDPRLYDLSAPFFPSVRALRLISWWE